ncbi:MAG: hypothetical protein ABW161_12585 [Candidatus Thiodiazotropha sp.]
MVGYVIHVSPNRPQKELARQFLDYDLVSVEVADEDNRLIGRVAVDNVIDVMDEMAGHQIIGAAGLEDEEDLFAPVLLRTSSRASWLGINLVTAFLVVPG